MKAASQSVSDSPEWSSEQALGTLGSLSVSMMERAAVQVTLVYKQPVDAAWESAAQELRAALARVHPLCARIARRPTAPSQWRSQSYI